MPAPEKLLRAIHSEFGIQFTPDEAASLLSFLDVHQAVVRRLDLADVKAAMGVWRRLLEVLDRTVKPGFGVRLEPAVPFEYYGASAPGAYDWERHSRRQLAQLLASYMRGEIGATVVGEHVLFVWEEDREPVMDATTTALCDIVDPYGHGDEAAQPVSQQRWEWLQRLVVALLADVPLEVRRYPHAAGETLPPETAFEPFWSAEEWEQQRGLLEQLRLPGTIPTYIPSDEAPPTASGAVAAAARPMQWWGWLAIVVLLAGMCIVPILNFNPRMVGFGVAAFAVDLAIVIYAVRAQTAPKPPVYTAIMVVRDDGRPASGPQST